MKKLLFFYFSVIFFVSCRIIGQSMSPISGAFVQTENSNIKLSFDGNLFTLIDLNKGMSAFTCCDTITYGDWQLDKKNKLLYLTTPEELNKSFLSISVKETKSESDSLVFIINNPIENSYIKGKTSYRDIYYKISLVDKEGYPLNSFRAKNFDTNVIKILKPKDFIAGKIAISIYPKNDFKGRNIGTREIDSSDYVIENNDSNIFNIDIPKLTFGYITYLRLNKDIVKIIDKNKLEWDGKIYIGPSH